MSGDEYDPLVTFKFDDVNYPVAGNRYYSSSGNESRAGRKNYDYRIKAKKNVDVSLMPQEIFDDGLKTYIKMRKENKYDLPVIYVLDPWDGKTISMVNYRVQDDYFVVDRVIEHGRLYFHQKFYIDFYNEGIAQKKIKEYRQRDTMVGRIRRVWDEGQEKFNEDWVKARDDVRREAGALDEKSSGHKKGIRVYSEEDLEQDFYGREQELERLQDSVPGSVEYNDEEFEKRQAGLRLKEERRLAWKAKKQELLEQERLRQEQLQQEALRRKEKKRLAREAKERDRQEEVQRVVMEKLKAEETVSKKSSEKMLRDMRLRYADFWMPRLSFRIKNRTGLVKEVKRNYIKNP